MYPGEFSTFILTKRAVIPQEKPLCFALLSKIQNIDNEAIVLKDSRRKVSLHYRSIQIDFWKPNDCSAQRCRNCFK